VEGTLFYLYNSFDAGVLSAFKARLGLLHSDPGGVRVLYYCPDHVSVFKGHPRWELEDRGVDCPWPHKGLTIATLLPS
jgi:hypothetical protein